MDSSQSVKVVMRISSRFPKWFVDDFTLNEWAQEFMIFAAHDVHWIWSIIERTMALQTSDYPPTLPKLVLAIGTEVGRLERDKVQRLPRPPEEPRIPQDEAAANIAKLRGIVQDAMPDPEAEPEILKRARAQSCDDLELDTLKTEETE